MANVTISMNRHALVDLALHGREDRVEDLFRRLNLTMRRLKRPFTGGRGFRRAPEGTGHHPGLHDVQRWLDSLRRRGKLHADDRAFLVKLYSTCRGRVRSEVLEKMESKRYLDH